VDYVANANLGRNGAKQYSGWCSGDCKNSGNGAFGMPLAATNYTNSYPYNNDMNSVANTVSQIAAPAQCIAFFEQVPVATTLNNPIEEAVADYLDITNMASTNNYFAGHTGLTDYVFCDGHVKGLKPLMTLSTADGGTASSNFWEKDGYAFSNQSGNYNANDLPSALHVIQAAQAKFN
jgi:prepilin-type processing-associated H-X9-DG protein